MGGLVTINLIFLISLNIISIFIAFWVYSANKKEKINQLFLLIIILMITWTDLNYCGDIVSQSYVALILKRLYLALVPIYFIFAYFFSIHFPKIILKRHPIFEKIAILSLITLSLATILTDAVVKNVEKKDWGFNIIPGNAINIFYFLVTIFILVILFNLIYKYFHLLPPDKLRIQYFIIGVIIYALFQSIFNIILPLVSGTKQYWQLGDFSAIFLIGFTAYAIVKQKLFGIRVVLTQVLVGIIAILLFAQILDSGTLFEYVWKGGLFITFIIFGYLLIRSVIREIKLREQLQEANAKLTKLDQAKSDFISIASHQLRTPLSAIKGYLSMVVDGDYGIVAEKVGQVLTRVYNSNERLIALVNNMLNISRIESGRIQFHPQPLQLELVINDVIGEIGPEARARQVQLIFKPLLHASRKVQADDKIIHEVLNNLVDNAVKYTPHGTVTISLHPQRQWLEVRVKDTGVGISPDDMPRLFKKFSRGQDVYKDYAIGSGLGLYVVKQMVEMHGGTVGVESAGTGKGSTFWFTVPYAIM